MTLAYLQPEELIELIKSLGKEAPQIDRISLFLEFLESRFDAWLGYRYAATDYDEELFSNNRGVIFLRHRPVIEVMEVLEIVPNTFDLPPQLVDIPSIWDKGDRLMAGCGRRMYQCKYRAGHDTIPPIIKDCLLGLIYEYLSSGGSLNSYEFINYANQSKRTLTNVSLPGGLSQTWRVNSGSTGHTGPNRSQGTIFDEAMRPLLDLRVRRQTIT